MMKQGKVITFEDLASYPILMFEDLLEIKSIKNLDRIILTDTEVQVYHNEWKVNRYTRRDK